MRQIYVYGNSERSYLLAVVVPIDAGLTKSAISDSLAQIARDHGLNGYEIPRDFLIETEPFSLENGLLSGVGKFLRPKLKDRYGESLQQLYTKMANDQVSELHALRAAGAGQPVLEAVPRGRGDPRFVDLRYRPEARFVDLGGDSLSALTFSRLLKDIFEVEVPVGVVIDPTADLLTVAKYIEQLRDSVFIATTFGSVHGVGSTTVRAEDLTLDKFISADTLKAAPSLPRPTGEVSTVLLTGSTGFLGRFLGVEWFSDSPTPAGSWCASRAVPTRHRRVTESSQRWTRIPSCSAGSAHWRSSTRGSRRGHQRARARFGRSDISAARGHRRPDRAPGRPRQPHAALQPVVRPERPGYC